MDDLKKDPEQEQEQEQEQPEAETEQSEAESEQPEEVASKSKKRSNEQSDTTFPEDEVAESIGEMINYIVRTIARKPDEIELNRTTEDDGLLLYTLTVGEEDKGRVIGREGRVAAAMRLLMRVAAVKAQIRVKLDIE